MTKIQTIESLLNLTIRTTTIIFTKRPIRTIKGFRSFAFEPNIFELIISTVLPAALVKFKVGTGLISWIEIENTVRVVERTVGRTTIYEKQ